MILICPECATRYLVPDSAVGPEGRQVRCAACKHSWFQDGVLPERPEPDIAASKLAAKSAEDTPAVPSAAPADDRAVPEAAPAAEAPQEPDKAIPRARVEERARAAEAEAAQAAVEAAPASAEAAPAAPARAVPVDDDVVEEAAEPDWSTAYDPPMRRRRNPARTWTMAALLFLFMVSAAGGALYLYGPPDWAVNLGLLPAQGGNGLDVELPRPPDRRVVSGQEVFSFNAVITNRSSQTLSVPPIVVELRDEQRRIVFSWMTKADKPRLEPGETARISESRLDIPKNARDLDIKFVDSAR